MAAVLAGAEGAFAPVLPAEVGPQAREAYAEAAHADVAALKGLVGRMLAIAERKRAVGLAEVDWAIGELVDLNAVRRAAILAGGAAA